MFREVAAAILDQVSERIIGGKWFLIGVIAASALTYGQVMATGDISGLLQVGENSRLRPTIEQQLGEVHLSPGSGHDGQIFYAIALDLSGAYVPDLIGEDPAYRYRRILFPALASAFGLLEGKLLLYSMIALNVFSVGLAAAAMALLSVRRGFSDWFALAVILNPGVWLSVIILTGDNLSLALMLVGLALLFSKRELSPLAFTGSVFAKEAAMLTPLGLGSLKRRSSWPIVLLPGLSIVVWMAWLSYSLGDGFTARGNLAFPFQGLVTASANWAAQPLDEWVLLLFAIGLLMGGMIAALLRKGPLRWVLVLWCVIGVLSSSWVWDFGNNAARAFAPLGVLVVLHLLYADGSPDRTRGGAEGIAPPGAS